MEKEEIIAPEPRLYEVGYHILPTVAEEDIPGQTTVLRNAIESRGGNVVADGMPVMMTLAYPLARVIANKRKIYSTAYFGWMKFEMTPDQAESLKKDLDANENILRFLLITTVIEKPQAAEKMAFMEEGESKTESKDDADAQPGDALKAAELDKTIDDLVIE